MKSYKIGSNLLSINLISDIISNDYEIELSSKKRNEIIKSRIYLEKKIKSSKLPIYGINTGFGSLCDHKISPKDLSKLQHNLVLSHACGTGDQVPLVIVKIMLLLKIKSLSHGYSGIHLSTLERLINMYNKNILPVIYEQGSLGASGDLSPLAHMSLTLIGEGDVKIPNPSDKKSYIVTKSENILKELNWDKLKLKSKEGLALLNGTQFMSAYGTWSLINAKRLSYFSDLIGTISLEAFNGRADAFDDDIQKIRPHIGQIKCAKNIRKFLDGSDIQNEPRNYVQDPYSFRCMPQVHGATKDVIYHVCNVFNIEINSVTDNPLMFRKEDKVVSGGNFHGQPLAMAMDYLAIALSELGNISERRVFQLLSGKRGLPSFLVSNPGLNSGLMITQYTAASIVSQNKQLCTPASVDSIVSSNGQEDHVSMGANSAIKLKKVTDNLYTILSIELLNAVQSLSFRKKSSSDFIENFVKTFKEEVSFIDEDRYLKKDIDKAISFLKSFSVDLELL